MDMACSHTDVMKNAHKILAEESKGMRHSEDLSIEGRKIVKCILQKYAWRM
jgi:hypothetical protein